MSVVILELTRMEQACDYGALLRFEWEFRPMPRRNPSTVKKERKKKKKEKCMDLDSCKPKQCSKEMALFHCQAVSTFTMAQNQAEQR